MTDFAKQVKLIEASGLFDRAWYTEVYKDVVESGRDPIEHYLRWGARMRRDPSPEFSTAFYLKQNPDVAKSGVNPLAHYVVHGRREGRRPHPPEKPSLDVTFDVDVVVPVYNALDDVQACLTSVIRHRDGLSVRLIVVNDGSNESTSDWLRSFFAENDCVDLIENPGNLGYTKAVNVGLRASNAAYVVTLNSDTIVTSGWLRGLIRCMNSDPRIGIVGPLSNAASWQSVPRLYDESRQFAINDTVGLTVEEFSRVVSGASSRRYPRLPFVNGFCFMIARRVLNAIGYMDEASFPVGFGEENDYCVRAADAGFSLAIADDVYVFHAKSKSFGHERRRELSKAGSEKLREKHTAQKFNALVERVKNTAELDLVRRDIVSAIESMRSGGRPVDPPSLRILFLLPVKGGGGGAHSVVQEAAEMRRMNIDARVYVKDRVADFIDQYPEIENGEQLFIGGGEEEIKNLAGRFDVVVGTIFRSMSLVADIASRHPHVLPAYYVQDYEPLFSPAGSPLWQEARDSYTLVPNALLFAKTAWIIGKVRAEHGVDVVRVSPSLDHEVYYPAPRPASEVVRVAAMIRPATPRRGAERTMRVFKALSDRFGNAVEFELFGCEANDADFIALEQDFPFRQRGRLKRAGVADLLRRSDLFVDLSDYQAFGRTGLEAMACGCITAITCHGGADEYAIDGVNALVVDSLDEQQCVERLSSFLDDRANHWQMRLEAIATASRYSVRRAAISEIVAIAKEYARRPLRPH